jgi:hypothetical protein
VLLSEREVELLRYLVANRGRAIARSELLERVWGLPGGDSATRAIDMHIVNLRDKLADPSAARGGADRARQGLHARRRWRRMTTAAPRSWIGFGDRRGAARVVSG